MPLEPVEPSCRRYGTGNHLASWIVVLVQGGSLFCPSKYTVLCSVADAHFIASSSSFGSETKPSPTAPATVATLSEFATIAAPVACIAFAAITLGKIKAFLVAEYKSAG